MRPAGTELLIEALPSKVECSKLDCTANSPIMPYHSSTDLWKMLQLILRTLNTSRSAFVAINFHSSFFDSHAVYDSRDVKGSVLIKVCLYTTVRATFSNPCRSKQDLNVSAACLGVATDAKNPEAVAPARRHTIRVPCGHSHFRIRHATPMQLFKSSLHHTQCCLLGS